MRTTMRRVVMALAFAAGAAASAQSSAPRDNESMNWVVRDDGHVYKIQVKDGKIVGDVDGQRLDDSRLRREGNVLRLVDEKGETIHEVRTAQGSAGNSRVWVGEDGRMLELTPDQGVQFTPQQQRVRLGVTISQPDDALAAQLGLKKGRGVLIESVNDGSAAQRSGMRAFDVIIEIDGQDEATSDTLRQALAKKQAGDTLRLVVVRNGDRLKLEPKLESFPIADAPEESRFEWNFDDDRLTGQQKAEIERALRQSMAEAHEYMRMSSDRAREMAAELHEQLAAGHEAWAEAREELAEAWEELKSELTDEQKEKIHEAFESVREALEDLDIDVELPRIRIFTDDDDQRTAVVAPTPPSPPRVRTPAAVRGFAAPAPATRDMEARLNSIEDRMSRIEALLERMAEQQQKSRDR